MTKQADGYDWLLSFMKELTDKAPPGPNRKHNITLNDKKQLVITVSLDEVWHSTTLKPYDFAGSPERLVKVLTGIP